MNSLEIVLVWGMGLIMIAFCLGAAYAIREHGS